MRSIVRLTSSEQVLPRVTFGNFADAMPLLA